MCGGWGKDMCMVWSQIPDMRGSEVGCFMSLGMGVLGGSLKEILQNPETPHIHWVQKDMVEGVRIAKRQSFPMSFRCVHSQGLWCLHVMFYIMAFTNSTPFTYTIIWHCWGEGKEHLPVYFAVVRCATLDANYWCYVDCHITTIIGSVRLQRILQMSRMLTRSLGIVQKWWINEVPHLP